MTKYGTYDAKTNKVILTEVQKKNFEHAATIDKPHAYNKVGSDDYNCYCKKYQNLKNILKNGKKDICAQAFYDKIWGLFLSNSVTVLILAVNFIIRFMVQNLLNNVGYHTESRRNKSVQIVTFVSAFINTGIIPLVTNAEFMYLSFPFNLIPQHKIHADFDALWYRKLGPSIVQTIAILAFMPYVGICISAV